MMVVSLPGGDEANFDNADRTPHSPCQHEYRIALYEGTHHFVRIKTVRFSGPCLCIKGQIP